MNRILAVLAVAIGVAGYFWYSSAPSNRLDNQQGRGLWIVQTV